MTAKEKFKALARKQKEAIKRQKAAERKRVYLAALKDRLGYCNNVMNSNQTHVTSKNNGTNKQAQAPEGYMSIKEAAKAYGYSYNAVQMANICGTLPCLKAGSRYYVKVADMDAYKARVAESRKVSAAAAHEAWKAKRAQRMGNA